MKPKLAPTKRKPLIATRAASVAAPFPGTPNRPASTVSALVLVIAAAAVVLVALPSRAAQAEPGWTRFRGPNGSGLSPAADLPSTWTDQDYRWKVRLPGPGHASPVVQGGKVFVVSGDKATARRSILCFKTSDGSLLWQRDYDSATFPKNRDNSYASSTPAVDGERLYVYWTTQEEVTLLALDHAGKQLWRRNLGPFKSQHGGGASPIVAGQLVVVNNDQEGPSSLLALDAATGTTRWEVKRIKDRAAYSTPLLRQITGGREELIFASSAHGITALDPQTGALHWELTNAFPFRVVGSPVLADGLIVGACGEGGVGRRVVAVRPPAANSSPGLAYEMKNSIPYVPTPLCRSGLLFLWGDNGLVTCHHALTGQRVWQLKISDSFYGSPVCAGDRLYCVSKKGNVCVISATGKAQLISTIALGDPSFATPAIADNAIFFRTETQLLCLPAVSAEK